MARQSAGAGLKEERWSQRFTTGSSCPPVVLIAESVIQPGNEPSFGKFLDLAMFVIPRGQKRTEKEYRTLFEEAGFRLTQIAPTKAEVGVVEEGMIGVSKSWGRDYLVDTSGSFLHFPNDLFRLLRAGEYYLDLFRFGFGEIRSQLLLR